MGKKMSTEYKPITTTELVDYKREDEWTPYQKELYHEVCTTPFLKSLLQEYVRKQQKRMYIHVYLFNMETKYLSALYGISLQKPYDCADMMISKHIKEGIRLIAFSSCPCVLIDVKCILYYKLSDDNNVYRTYEMTDKLKQEMLILEENYNRKKAEYEEKKIEPFSHEKEL